MIKFFYFFEQFSKNRKNSLNASNIKCLFRSEIIKILKKSIFRKFFFTRYTVRTKKTLKNWIKKNGTFHLEKDVLSLLV